MAKNNHREAIITGGRNFDNVDFEYRALDAYYKMGLFEKIVNGKCPTGADEISSNWAMSRGVPFEVVPAAWSQYGKRAGPLRNKKMAERENAVVCIAFTGTHGTDNMVKEAKANGLKVVDLRGKEI